MIPFDLEQLDDPDHIGQTADAVEALAKDHLGKAGLERDGSAILLSRFYMRWVHTALGRISFLIPAGRT